MASALRGEGVSPKADDSTDRLRDHDSNEGRAAWGRGSKIPTMLWTSCVNVLLGGEGTAFPRGPFVAAWRSDHTRTAYGTLFISFMSVDKEIRL